MSRPIHFNPLFDYHALKSALPAVVSVYDLDGEFDYSKQTQSERLFNVSTQGNLAGSMAYAIAAHAAKDDAAMLIGLCRQALVMRMFGDTEHKDLGHEQQSLKAYILGLMCDLESAFEQPDTPSI